MKYTNIQKNVLFSATGYFLTVVAIDFTIEKYNNSRYRIMKIVINDKQFKKGYRRMKKTALVIAMATASVSAMAADVEVRDAYIGAEIGGNFLLGDDVTEGGAQDDGTFKASNMVKVGAELGTQVTQGVEAFVATEARIAVEGTDSDWDEGKYDGEKTDLYKFTVGVDTVAGRTEFGILEGEADNLDGYADLSMEHGLDAHFGAAINGEDTLQHIYATERFTATASYDFDTEAAFVGGTVKVAKGLELGAAYVDSGDAYERVAGLTLDDHSAYTLGAVYSLEKIDLAAKYISEEAMDETLAGYSLGAAYALNPKTKLAATFNDSETSSTEDDQWFTVGASYQFNKNVEFVTDYKVGSDEDDQLFVRANLNF